MILGAGQAGERLAAALRDGGHGGEILLLGAEPDPPYQRPPLSKAYLLGEMARERLHLRAPAWYADLGVALRLGAPATAVSLAERTVTVGGEAIAWDALAFATGSEAVPLPHHCTGGLPVHLLRTLADADRLAPEIREGRRLLVVGGGYVGLEVAAVAASRGMRVTVVELAHRILGRVAAPETADWYRALHRAHGVEIREGVGLDRLLGAGGRVEGARLTDEAEIAVDAVVAGVGARPATALAEAAGIACEGGILVDELGRTSAPGVWAAGDCARLPLNGRLVRLESVQNAIDGAEAVARNMLGAGEPYRPRPWFWSDQYDVKLQIAGLSEGHDRVAVRAGGAGRSHWYYAGPRLIAVDAMNAPRDYMVGKRLIEAGRSPDPSAVEAARDAKALLGA